MLSMHPPTGVKIYIFGGKLYFFNLGFLQGWTDCYLICVYSELSIMNYEQ